MSGCFDCLICGDVSGLFEEVGYVNVIFEEVDFLVVEWLVYFG